MLLVHADPGRAVTAHSVLQPPKATTAAWLALVKPWQQPNAWRATWQLVATLTCYVGLWFLLWLSLAVSWWLTVPLAACTGALMVRVFILLHDCGHGAFYASRLANDMVGQVLGVLTFTPYTQWRTEHSIHHASTCNLGRRGTGDIWTMTVQEYLQASRWKRFAYRLARNPVVLFAVAPLVLFLILERWHRPGARAREVRSVWFTNVAVAGMAFGLGCVFGFLPYLIIQLIVMAVAGAIGIWLFYLQHQFEDTYWERGDQWDYVAAALQGSSYFRMPRVLQWLTGNIGFHHIHHLNARIPNYNLQRCHESTPLLQTVRPMTLLGSLKSLSLRLWDESSKQLVGFRHLRTLPAYTHRRGAATARRRARRR